MTVDTKRVSTASDKNSECVPTVVPKLAAVRQAASEVVQPRPPDSAGGLTPAGGQLSGAART